MEGQIETTTREWATKGERVDVVRHEDNLRSEGTFATKQTEKWAPGERDPYCLVTHPKGLLGDRDPTL